MRTSGKRPAKRFDKKDDKPFNRSKKSSSSFDKKDEKPFKRGGSSSKSSDSREDRPFEKRENKPYNRTGSASKPFGKRVNKSYDDSKAFDKKEEKPFKRGGSSFKSSDSREDRPFEKRENKPYNRAGSASKPYVKRENKAYDDSKAFDKKEVKPYKGPKAKKSSKSEGIRLNKYLANAGICSRREADELIVSGLVEINGVLVTELGIRVKPTDNVKYDGGVLATEKKVYILLNKPKDYVTTVDDAHAKKTVMELVANACKERVYPVGRLDRNTTGVLLLTNDGDLTTKLTHPKFEKKKVYHVFCDKKVTQGDIARLLEGFELEDGFAQADVASYIEGQDKNQVGIEIHSGKNRIVRRMFDHLGYNVTKLDRVVFAGLTKKLLPRGKWRFLSQKEVDFLKML